MHQSERYHALDFLRAFAMLLGIVIHGLLAYFVLPVPFWPVHDKERGLVADLTVFTTHTFRMQTFFLLAGFFGCMLYARYHLRGLALHRFRRIVVPFTVALLLVQPVLQAIWLSGDPNTLRIVGLPDPGTGADRGEVIARHFTSGAFLASIRPFHLWFLYYLCVLFLLMVPVIAAGRRLEGTRLAARLDAGFRRLAASPLKAAVLAVPLVPLLWRSRFWSVDTPESWPIQSDILAYYFVFFAIGWMLFRHRDVLAAFSRRWRAALLVGNLLVLPVMLVLTKTGLDLIKSGQADDTGSFLALKTTALYLNGVYSWLMVAGLMGAFEHWFSRARAWVRYLADAAYWCYIVHLIPIVLLQMALAPLPLPGFVKFLIVGVGTVVTLLVTYEYLVRYTLIGTVLNGPKNRAAAQRAVVDPGLTPATTPAAEAAAP